MSARAAPWDLCAPAERDYFERYGPGLVVLLPADPVGISREGRPSLPHGGAWLHVGESGLIQAFSGKVDVGQGTRRALVSIVARELSVPESQVQLLMGDTDLAPWDVGTFGSLAMPSAAPLVRAVAVRARELLLSLGAQALEASTTELLFCEGRVEVKDSTRSRAFGELVRGLERVETAVPFTAHAPHDAPSVPRTSEEDREALEAVTGARRFTSDLRRPGMLHGGLLHPPAYGATLRRLDATRATALAGVRVVSDAGFVGVTAPSPELVRRALEALGAEWEDTAGPSEATIEQYLRTHPAEGDGFWGALHHEVGDVDRSLAGAAVTLSATYTTAYIAHVPLECRAALAEWSDGRLTVWVGTQRPFDVRRQLAESFAVNEAQVRVIVPPTGSGFGGKHTPEVAIAAARLARGSGKPVKLTYSREEEFTRAYFRPMAVIDVRSGSQRDGTLSTWIFENVNSGAAAIHTPYRVPHQRIDYQPAASPLPQGSYRALAATANHFARESHMDELAAQHGRDPLEYRLSQLADERLATVLRSAAERIGWAGRRAGPGHGFGIAAGLEKASRVASAVEVRVHSGGELELVRIVTAFECGAIVDRENLSKQVEGALVMGLGGALFEAIHFESGRILNPRLSQYRVPRFSDVPRIEVELLDRPDLPSAGGGETPIVAIAPALAGAIFEATGRRLRALPLAPNGRIG